jgi:hypothetical protein
MKIAPRNTAKRSIAVRITAPETKVDPATGKKIPLLSYIDAGSYQQHKPTTKDLFLYAAGTNEEGEVPDGLDRLSHHKYVVHTDKDGKAIGLDVIPSRLYRSGVMPVKQEGVKTLIVQFLVNGAVARVTQRPFNVRFEQSHAVIQELDKLISAGKQITASMKLGEVGRVVSAAADAVEVKLNASRRRIQGEANTDTDDLQDDDVDDVAAAEVAEQIPA